MNVCTVDGAVRYVSDTVDTGQLRAGISIGAGFGQGESIYGVWGSMGTIDRGEGKSL